MNTFNQRLSELVAEFMNEQTQLKKQSETILSELNALKRKFEDYDCTPTPKHQKIDRQATEKKTVKPPECPTHHIDCIEQVCKTDKNNNKGKHFYCCPKKSKCFFRWKEEHIRELVRESMVTEPTTPPLSPILNHEESSESLFDSEEDPFTEDPTEQDTTFNSYESFESSDKKRTQFWQTADDIHMNGMKIQFRDSFEHNSVVKIHVNNSRTISNEHLKIMNIRFKQYEEAGIIKRCDKEFVKFCAAVTVVPRPGHPERPREILNFKPLNVHITKTECLLPTRQELIRMVELGTKAVTLDIVSCYTNIKLHPSAYPYCCIRWNNVFYHFTRVPFGISCAPACCQVLTRSFVDDSQLEAVYLDDFLLIRACPEVLKSRLEEMKSNLDEHGLPVSDEKSVLSPSTIIHYAGYTMDFEKKSIVASPKSMDSLENRTSIILSNGGRVSYEDLRSYIGIYAFCRSRKEDKYVHDRLTKRLSAGKIGQILTLSKEELTMVKAIPERCKLTFNY